MNNVLFLASKTKYKVKGLNLENFIFSLTSGNISIYKLKRKKNSIIFSASSINNKQILQIANNLGLSVTVLGEVGFINLIKSLPYYIGIMLGVVYSALCLLHFTGYITDIQIIVPENHICNNTNNCLYCEDSINNIKNFIAQYINVGSKYSVNSYDLQNKVMANFELVESCSIVKTGNSVIINLTEASVKQGILPNQIIAKQNCIITSITTFSGIAKVKAGDVVVAGQVLVDSNGSVLPRANITAKVWYIGTAFHNCKQMVLTSTNNTFTSTKINVCGKTIINDEPCEYQYYTATTKKSYICNMFIPVTKITTTYTQMQLVEEYVPFDNVKETILAQSKNDALSKTNGSAQECTYSIVSQGDIVRVDCYLLVIEQLGTA